MVKVVVALLAVGAVLSAAVAGAGAMPSTDGDDGATTSGAGDESGGADDGGPAGADDALLAEGATVYSQICSSCHQPGGAGLPGQYPPLLDNPNVEDEAYLLEVINNGRQGEIEVLGETYNGVMPAQSTLSDADKEAVIAYIQSGFSAPAADEAAFAEAGTGPVAGTELPALADAGSIIAYLLAAAIVGLVLAPRLVGVNDRLATPWLDAWLKTAVIVLGLIFFVVIVPNWLLQLEAVADLDRPVQDLIGSAAWGLGLLGCLAALWYAHRESRI